MESHGKGGVAVVAVIVGIVLGGAGGWWIADMNKSNTNQKTDSNNSSMQVSAETDGVTVGGAKMVKTKDIVDNAAAASNVTTLVDLVKKADLVETLKGEGPFTVFGPDNDAFGKLPAATVADLQKPENKKALANILTYHVVAGTYTSADLRAMAAKGEMLTTVQGDKLTPIMEDNALYIEDAKGGKAKVDISDVISSNGVTHVIDSVLMPKS